MLPGGKALEAKSDWTRFEETFLKARGMSRGWSISKTNIIRADKKRFWAVLYW